MGTDQGHSIPLTAASPGAACLSIIIPTLNEAANLPRTLKTVQATVDVEIIIVDGGSQDGTQAVAQALGAKVMTATGGRAHQMNVGAEVATGDSLLFLHADTRLPAGFDQWIQPSLKQPGVVAGAFELAIDDAAWGFRLVEWGVRLRSRWGQMPYGDQAIFMARRVFQQIGGFPEMPIMEDFELMRRLRRQGRIEIAPVPVLTSSRRWRKLNIVRTTLINQVIVAGYLLGVSPEKLAHWYRHWGR